MADHEAGQGAAESILLALSETRLGDAVDALAAAVAEARFSVALSGRSLVPPQPHDALVMILPRAHAPLGLRRLPMSGDFRWWRASSRFDGAARIPWALALEDRSIDLLRASGLGQIAADRPFG